jgi:trans-aconitate methyltransferase
VTDPATLCAGYFDALYRAAPDPWGFENRWYEQRKYAISLAQLPLQHYRSAFEAGCSIGVFTELLAQRCGALLSWDLALGAVEAAARRTDGLPHVRVEQHEIPREWPRGRFDLIVLSEVLYYFGDDDLQQVLNKTVASLEPEGALLAVHWRHHVPDYPRSGDDAHRLLARRPGLARLVRHTEPDFLAEIFIKTDGTPVSVAQATGLA